MAENPTTKPLEVIDWAASGTKLEPGAPKKDAGWLFEEIHPSDFENWLRHFTATIVNWTRTLAVRSFTDLYSAIISDMVAGDVCHVDGFLTPRFTDAPVEVVDSDPNLEFIATDGRYVFHNQSGNGSIRARRTDDPTTVAWTTADLGLASITCMACDGAIVAVGSSVGLTKITILDALTGAVIDAVDSVSGNAVRDIVCASDKGVQRVYWAEADRLSEWNSTSGVAATFVLAGGGVEFHAVEADGDYIYGADIVTPNVSGGTTRILTFDAAASNVATFTLPNLETTIDLASDGDLLYYIAHQAGAVPTVPDIGVAPRRTAGASWAGQALWGGPFLAATGAPSVPAITVDDRYVYVVTAGELLVVLEKHTGAIVWSNASEDYADIAVDGIHLWAADSAALDTLRKYGTGRLQGRLWIRANPGSPAGPGSTSVSGRARKPFRKLMLPHTDG